MEGAPPPRGFKRSDTPVYRELSSASAADFAVQRCGRNSTWLGKPASGLKPEQRLAGLLELAKQQRSRFHELEQIEWRINFSVWASLGGLAFLWANGHLAAPAWLLSPRAYLLAIAPTVIHGLAVIKLNQQQQQLSALARRSWTITDALLEIDIPPVSTTRRHFGLRIRDWYWVGWDLVVTASLSVAVVLLVQHVTVRP